MSEPPDIRLDTPFRVADWLVEPDQGRISRGSDEVKLEPKVMTVLVCLAAEAGKTLSREHIESIAWAGTVVGYDSLATTIIKLRKAFADDSRNPSIIETVTKRGYRLIAPVRLAEADTPSPPGESLPVVPSLKLYKTMTWLALSLSVFVVCASILVYLQPTSDQPLAAVVPEPGFVVAVLPFKNIGSDPNQVYFSEGMTADLITSLSTISSISVIARNSAFSYRGQDIDIVEIGQELKARYVVDGSVRKAGSDIRIWVRLVDVQTGVNTWARRFEGKLHDVFALQDQVTTHIVNALEVRLSDAEQKLLMHKYTNSVEAYDHFLQGWRHFWNMSREGNEIARESYLRAIALDENFARAYANLSLTYAYEHLNGWSTEPDQTIKKAIEYAEKAFSLDDTISQVYWALGVAQSYSRNYKQALKTAKKALELNPNYADGYGLLATVLNYAGKPKQALEAMSKAMRLNPRHPSIYRVMRGEMHFNAADYQSAIDDFLFSLESNPGAQEPRLWLASAYVHAGDIEEAEWQIEQLLTLDPKLSLEKIEQAIPLMDPSQRKHLIVGLYRAGMR